MTTATRMQPQPESQPQAAPRPTQPQPPARAKTVAVLGAGGTMGFPIARNILRAGIPVRAWNRSAGKAEPLALDGAYVATSPAEAARGASIVLTILADEGAVLAAMEGPYGALSAMPGPNHEDGGTRMGEPGGHPHAIWLQMSTIGEDATHRCIQLANARGVGFVDAPVLGTREPAADGNLVILESGPEEARPWVQPVFDAIGHRTIRAGQAGAGSRLKLVTNAWVESIVEAAAETVALAEGLGLDPALFFQAIEGGPLDLPYLQVKGQMMLKREFTPAFRLELALKDAELVRRAARQHGLSLPLPEVIADRLAQGAREHGDLDFSATYLTSSPA
jgi:3-hydroxyisobutyrate dehydrogenase